MEADQDLLQQYNADGYCIARGILDDLSVSNVLADFQLSIIQKLEQLGLPINSGVDNESLTCNMKTLLDHDKDDYIRVLRLACRLHSVHALMMHQKIVETLHRLNMKKLSLTAGVAAHVVSDQLRIPGGYMGWAPHQDWTAAQGSLKQIVIWAPLMDIDDDFYPLKVIPGSHRKGIWRCDRDKVVTRGALIEVLPEEHEKEDWLALDMTRGDVVFMSGFMVHATGAGNRSGVRIACGSRYEDITEGTFVERGYPTAFSYAAVQEELYPGFPEQKDIDKLFT